MRAKPALSIFSPVSRLRRGPRSTRPLPSELMWCGPEAGFEEVPDRVLAERAFREVNRVGFRVPVERMDDPAACHWVMRRNRAPAHRDLYTPPGERMSRPPTASPVENVTFAGAWIRNPTALPCVEAAAESARAAAERVAANVARARRGAEVVVPFRGMPRLGPLVLPPPFQFRDVAGWVMVVDVDRAAVAELLPPELRALPGFGGRALLGAFHHRDVFAPGDPTRTVYAYHEVVLAALVQREGRRALDDPGVFPLMVYLDDDTALAAGREVYGYPKKLARVEIGPGGMRVERAGRAPDAPGEGRAAPLELLAAEWVEGDPDALAPLAAWSRLASAIGAGALDDRVAAEVRFYTALELPSAVAGGGAALARLHAMPVRELRVRRARGLRVASVRVGRSATDPVYRLAPHGVFRVRAAAALEASFVMGDAEGGR